MQGFEDVLAWLREYLGSTLFGALTGWILRMLVSPTKSPLIALRNMAIGVALAVVLARPIAHVSGTLVGLEGDDLIEATAAMLAISGEHSVDGLRRLANRIWNGRDGNSK